MPFSLNSPRRTHGKLRTRLQRSGTLRQRVQRGWARVRSLSLSSSWRVTAEHEPATTRHRHESTVRRIPVTSMTDTHTHPRVRSVRSWSAIFETRAREQGTWHLRSLLSALDPLSALAAAFVLVLIGLFGQVVLVGSDRVDICEGDHLDILVVLLRSDLV